MAEICPVWDRAFFVGREKELEALDRYHRAHELCICNMERWEEIRQSQIPWFVRLWRWLCG